MLGSGVNKFRAIRTEVDGISFASKKESRRYSELRLLERAGKIYNITLQPRFPLTVNGKLICTYVADFSYYNSGIMSKLIVEDAKGIKTPVYKLKAKLFEAIMGYAITET